MSAIGGIVDLNNKEVDFSGFNKMRLSMSLRGRKRSTAFLQDGVGMFFNCSYPDSRLEKEEYYQPNICERRGKIMAVCVDSESLLPLAVGEKYFIHGIDFLGCFNGDFALSLYDEERDILILSRDRCGRRPLFYRVYKNKIYFSSEIKGILDGIGEDIFIDREALEFHLTAPVGAYRSADIYTSINEVRAGECVIFSKFGLSKFFYRDKREERHAGVKKGIRAEKESIVSLYPRFYEDKLGEYLGDALMAFDYPQFDCYIPSLIETLAECATKKKYHLRFEDALRRQNLTYARERDDRLGSLYGIHAVGTFAKAEIAVDNNYLNKIYISVKDRFFSMKQEEMALLVSIFGKHRFDGLLRFLEGDTKKEDTEKNIRILAMLCQTVEWLSSRAICIGSTFRHRDFL